MRGGRPSESKPTVTLSSNGRSAVVGTFRDGVAGRALGGVRGKGVSRGLVGQVEEGARSRSKLYLSAALALTAGAVAYWSNSEADDAYDSYLRSAGAVRQRDRFDRAEGYDRVSGAVFIAMEVGIALSTYLLFFGS